MSTQNAIIIASVGLDETTSSHINSYINLHRDLEGTNWKYHGNLDPQLTSVQLINSDEFDIILLDVDCPLGQRSRYTLTAMNPDLSFIFIAKDPTSVPSGKVLTRPLIGKDIIESIAQIVSDIKH